MSDPYISEWAPHVRKEKHKVILYATTETSFDFLKSFKYKNYIPICYGNLINKWWFSYGYVTYINTKPAPLPDVDGLIYFTNESYDYMINKTKNTEKLLVMCDKFGDHTHNYKTDIEIENVGKGSLIKCVSDILENMNDKQCFNDGQVILYLI